MQDVRPFPPPSCCRHQREHGPDLALRLLLAEAGSRTVCCGSRELGSGGSQATSKSRPRRPVQREVDQGARENPRRSLGRTSWGRPRRPGVRNRFVADLSAFGPGAVAPPIHQGRRVAASRTQAATSPAPQRGTARTRKQGQSPHGERSEIRSQRCDESPRPHPVVASSLRSAQRKTKPSSRGDLCGSIGRSRGSVRYRRRSAGRDR